MGEKDHLNNSRLQAENDLSAKKLALSETRNRQASRKQAQEKIDELGASEKALTIEIEVGSVPNLSTVFTNVLLLQKLDKKSEGLDQPIKEAENKLRTTQQKWNRELNEARREIEVYSRSAANIKQISDEMRR
jgi:hypothetical protein